MAIEDGMVLARCMSKYVSEPVTALVCYEAARRERTNNIVQRSAAMAATFHNDALIETESATSYVSSNWHPDKIRTRYDTIYHYDAMSAEI
jgi:salicylate hydroxylase